ncbi:MAG TPA: MIP/aquaporin family protein [Pirellulaceae bacterium]|nr:MIP/aquaporin family protein [Pirellulaceae bacterium]
MPSTFRTLLAETLGTFLLVLFGCGAVHAAVLTGAQSGLWQVAIVWGMAVMFAVYAVGAVSGAHINPAITVAFAVWGRFPWGKVVPYIVAQLGGAMLAASALFVIYGPNLAAKEREKGITRGQLGSIVTAMCYGEYYPNPAPIAALPEKWSDSAWAEYATRVTFTQAFVAEVLGTAVLAFMVFAVSDGKNAGAPPSYLAPVFIGLTVAALISIIAPLTQACLNPARDFGPRLFAFIAGWQEAAIPGPNGHGIFTVYIAAPILGGILGGGLYDWLIKPAFGETK